MVRTRSSAGSVVAYDPGRALREAEARAARKNRVKVAELNAGLENYGATRSPAFPGWQAARSNSAAFGSRDARFGAFWRDSKHRDPTPHVGGPAAYECDVVGRANPKPSIGTLVASTKNPFRYGEMHGLTSATSVGVPEINDWWCDVGKEGCLRPVSQVAHGRPYAPGAFWYRENLCVCEACYRAGLAEDRTGHSAALNRLDSEGVTDHWMVSELHKYLGFAGAQARRDAATSEREETEQILAMHRAEHRQRGESLRHAAEAQRASAQAAVASVRQARAASVDDVRRDLAERARAARDIDAQRAQHAYTTAAEVQSRVIVEEDNLDVVC